MGKQEKEGANDRAHLWVRERGSLSLKVRERRLERVIRDVQVLSNLEGLSSFLIFSFLLEMCRKIGYLLRAGYY